MSPGNSRGEAVSLGAFVVETRKLYLRYLSGKFCQIDKAGADHDEHAGGMA